MFFLACLLNLYDKMYEICTYMSVLEPASIHTEVEAGGDPLDRQEAGIVRRTLKYRCRQTNETVNYCIRENSNKTCPKYTFLVRAEKFINV